MARFSFSFITILFSANVAFAASQTGRRLERPVRDGRDVRFETSSVFDGVFETSVMGEDLSLNELPGLERDAAVAGASLKPLDGGTVLRGEHRGGEHAVAKMGSEAAIRLDHLAADIVKPGHADAAARKAFSGEEDRTDGPIRPPVVEMRSSGPIRPPVIHTYSDGPIRPPVIEAVSAGPIRPPVIETDIAGPIRPPVIERSERVANVGLAAWAGVLAFLAPVAAFASTGGLQTFDVGIFSLIMFGPMFLPYSVGVAAFHAYQEGKGRLWRYFGERSGNRLVRNLPSLAGFAAIVLPALILQVTAAWFAFHNASPFALGVLVGGSVGDWFFSHYRLAEEFPLEPNPGYSSSWIYLINGAILVAVFGGLFISSLTLWLGVLAGAGFFALVLPGLRLSAPLANRIYARWSGR